jgi:hypothetical protein
MRKIIILTAALLVLAPLAMFGQSDGYYDRSYVRMSYVQGDVFVQRGQDLGYEQGEVNLVVIAGDKIGTRSGRLELQLGRRNYVRLDNDTVVELAALPGSDGQPTKIHVLSGSVFVRIQSLDGARNFELHSPDASFYLLGEGLYRLDVRENRESELSVLEGEAEASGEEGSLVVRSSERVTAADGRFVEDAGRSAASIDDFRSWNDSRDAVFARPASRTYLPAEYADYETELSDSGSWSYEPDYGNVWVPRTTYVDWRPYHDGRWVWYPIIGWTWVSSEPWGWCTSHYGRWGWRFGLGWYWIPMRHWGWGPAWVHWHWDRDYVGWCPLSYYNYPGVLIGNRFYDRYSRGDFPIHSRTLTMVHRGQLQDRNLRGRALSANELDRVGRINLRNTQPDLRPNLVRNGDLASRARGVVSRDGVRGVTRNFGGGASRLAPDALGRSVIRKSDASGASGRPTAGNLGGTSSGSRVIRRSESAQAPRALREFPARNSRESGSGQALTPRRSSGSTGSPGSRVLRPNATERTIKERPSSSTAPSARSTTNGRSSSSRVLRSPSSPTAFPSRSLGSSSRSTSSSSLPSRILRSPSGSGSSSSRPVLRSPLGSGSTGRVLQPRRSASSSGSSAPSRGLSSPSRSLGSSSRPSAPSRSMSSSSRSSGGSSSRSVGSSSRSTGSSSRSSGSSSRSSSARSSSGGRVRKSG